LILNLLHDAAVILTQTRLNMSHYILFRCRYENCDPDATPSPSIVGTTTVGTSIDLDASASSPEAISADGSGVTTVMEDSFGTNNQVSLLTAGVFLFFIMLFSLQSFFFIG